jgi:hypothetical protein
MLPLLLRTNDIYNNTDQQEALSSKQLTAGLREVRAEVTVNCT